jgi:hypothetical protein
MAEYALQKLAITSKLRAKAGADNRHWTAVVIESRIVDELDIRLMLSGYTVVERGESHRTW